MRLLILLAVACTSVDPDDEPVVSTDWSGCDMDDTWKELRASVRQQMERQGVPNASVAVVCDGVLAYRAALGPDVDNDTRYQIASTTKMFTAAAAMSQVEEGLLAVDDAVMLPGVNTSEPYASPATLHHLMSHTAGYPTFFLQSDNRDFDLGPFFVNNGEAMLWSEPGAVWNYSNLGTSLVGRVLEVTEDRPFADLVHDRVFMPAGMDRATLHAEEVEDDGNYAPGHSAGIVYDPTDSYLPTGYYGPMGGAWMSASDLAKWGLAHIEDGAPLGVDSWEALREGHAPTGEALEESHGYFLFRQDDRAQTVWSHSGSVAGWLSQFIVIPEAGFAVAVLFNSDSYSPYFAAWEAAESFVDLGERADPADHPIGEGYAGTYVSEALGTFTVDEDLQLSGDGVPTQTLVPAFGDTFMADLGAGSLSFRFIRDEAGDVRYAASVYGVGERSEP